MTQTEQEKNAKDFFAYWNNRGDEKQETARFWIQLLQDVLSVSDATGRIEFEKPVRLTHTSYIDAYIPETKVLIEQKSAKIDLHKAYAQSDGAELTPFEQAKRYVGEMKASEKPRWIVVCNFREFLVYDLEEPTAEPQQILLSDLPKEFYRLQFLVDQRNENIRREEEISLAAGRLVGKLYDALYKEYAVPEDAANFRTETNPRGLSPSQLRALNILCVRIVFCLYAEDAGLFATKTAFEDYTKSFATENLRDGIIKLFKALDTEPADRDKYDAKLQPFPYVNGGLFKDEQIEIPNFMQEIVDVIVNHCAPFNWSEISPTIFGAVFESTLNPDTRRTGGMHYTSIANIHRVIDPLFMDDLNTEFEKICAIKTASQRNEKLTAFQKKLGSLTFLDPACGSGNFLTETYLSLRKLENKVLAQLLAGGQMLIDFTDDWKPIKVSIGQFYGIEINDFAVTVAKTALWITENQMMKETEKIVERQLNFLPLKSYTNIVEGNALRMDWATLRPVDESAMPADGLWGFDTRTDGTARQYDYIMGNPPFVGARLMEQKQKDDLLEVFGKHWENIGNMDYVCGWYRKALAAIKGTDTRCAFVSTNSVSQGGSVANLWKPLFDDGLHIDFAWRTFRWANETTDKKNMAAVHCVIIGFSVAESGNQKVIFQSDGQRTEAKNINGYLLDMPNVFVESRQNPICDVPKIGIGNKPIDGGNYLFSEEEMKAFVKKEPSSEKYFRKWLGADEFINRSFRYCLWLGDCSPNELRSMPECYKRVQAVREYRLASKSAGTRKIADTPTRFHVENFPKGNYLLVPSTSSENRQYVPIGFLDASIIASNATHLIPNATLYHFGVLTSLVHMAWMRTVAGRLKSDYRSTQKTSCTIIFHGANQRTRRKQKSSRRHRRFWTPARNTPTPRSPTSTTRPLCRRICARRTPPTTAR